MGIRVDYKNVVDFLGDLENKADVAMRMYARQGALKMQNYAKTHRKWTDRTGMARATLNGYVENLQNVIRINISHGVSYGVYLELCNEKKYAILNETVQRCSKEILKGFDRLVDRL